MPLSHISLTVSHLPTSTSFYLSALQPLGYKYTASQNQPGQAQSVGFGVTAPDFFIVQETPGVPAGAAHVAFPAPSRGAVHDFFHAALKAGGTIHGEPRLRDERDEGGYYSAAVIDFDGNSVEAVYKGPVQDALPPAASAVGSTTRSTAPAPVAESLAPAKSVASARSVAPARSIAPAKSVVPPPKSITGNNGGTNSLTADLLDQARSAVNIARSVADAAIPGAVTVPAVSSSPSSNESSKTLVGTLLGAAAGAFVAYQMTKSESPPPSHSHAHPRSEHHPPTQVQRSSTFPPQPQYQPEPSYEYAPVQLALEGPRSGYESSQPGSRSGAPAYSIVEEESIYVPASSVAPSHAPSYHSSHSKAKSHASSHSPKKIEPKPPSASTIVSSFIAPTEVVLSRPEGQAKSTHSRTSSSSKVSEVTIRGVSRSSTAPSAAGIALPASLAPSTTPSKASSKAPSKAPSEKDKSRPLYEGSLVDLGSVAPSDSISQVSSRPSSHRSKTLARVEENGSVVTVKPAKSSSGSKHGSREGSRAGSRASSRERSKAGSKHGSRDGSRERGSKAGSKTSRRSERPESKRGSTVTLPVKGSDRDSVSVRSKGYQSVLESFGI